MMRTCLFLVLVFAALNCSAQAFEPDRGGFYFFSPIKDGYISMSTVGLNIGVGEYVSSGNTITTYYKDGSLKGMASVDCSDGITTGFANERNDYSYLSSAFYNTQNSFYKLILYFSSSSGDLDRVTINVKGLFSKVLGRGKYALDLNYGLATSNAFIFVFSKYEEGVVSYYLVKVDNKSRKAEITPISLESTDDGVLKKQETDVKFIYNGDNKLAAVQLVNEGSDYRLKMNTFSLDSLVKLSDRSVSLQFITGNFKPSLWVETSISRTYEAYLPSILDRGNVIVPELAKFYFSGDDITMAGLYFDNRKSELVGQRADGMFNVKIGLSDTIKEGDVKKMPFTFVENELHTPRLTCLSTNAAFYCAILYQTSKMLELKVNGDLVVNLAPNSMDPVHGLVFHFDKDATIDKKYLREEKSKLYQSIQSVFCLYNMKTNSVGNYTRFSLQTF